MRINRLDLTRYGIFTDRSIDFGNRTADETDLHIIYGPNETGKSTTLAAIIDLLFGIESRSKYGFLHPYAAMRIGGDVEVGGKSRRFVRLKRPLNSLLDGDEKPISDGAILGDLGGIDRASYATMFSLDDDTLEVGGENILASKGDLGQLLFSASAGLSDLSSKLEQTKLEADAFYKYRSRSNELSEIKTRILELKKKREALDVVASDHAKLTAERDRLSVQYTNAIAERGRNQSRLNVVRRQLGALPRLTALRGLRDRLKPLVDIPEAPPHWGEELPKLQRSEIEIDTRSLAIASEMERIGVELEEIVVDQLILKLSERIELLAESRARYVTAARDVPERRLQQRDADVAIASIIARIECAADVEPASLLLSASITGELRKLMEGRSGVETKKKTAEDELDDARRRLADAESAVGEAQGETQSVAPAALSELQSAMNITRVADYAARHRIARRHGEEQSEALSERMRALRPWLGEAVELRDLAVPDATEIDRWKRDLALADKALELEADKIEQLATEERRLVAEVDAAAQIVGVLSDQEAATIRTAREQAWAGHKVALSGSSADSFESYLRQDDIVTNGRISNAADVARLNEIGKKLVLVKSDHSAAVERKQTAIDRSKDLLNRIGVAIQSISPLLPPDLSLAKLEGWLVGRDNALLLLSSFEKAQREQREAEEDGENLRQKLVKAAYAAGLVLTADATVDDLLALAQDAIDKDAELTTLRTDVTEHIREVNERERKAKAALEEEQDWSSRWDGLCARTWFVKNGVVPTVSTVGEILRALDELGRLIENRIGLSDRIEKMENDQLNFATQIAELEKSLGLSPGVETLESADHIAKALGAARMAETAKQAAATRLKNAEARKRDVGTEKESHGKLKLTMTTFFSVESLEEVAGKLRSLESRRELKAQAEAAEEEILLALNAPSIGEAEEILTALDSSAMEAEASELEAQYDDLDKRSRELFGEHTKAVDRVEAVGTDNDIARIDEQRRTALLQIEEGANRYLRLRLGIAATEQALRIYRDRHRSSMMARASDAFRVVSRGAYSGLATQPNGDTEMLVAIGAKEGSKCAADLSKGTRFQLYLALRVAGYQEFAQSRTSVPFIADDIMETFDDFRAEEAFKLFGEMGKVGQVVYLTHHKHLCQIAQRVCPQVRIHELG